MSDIDRKEARELVQRIAKGHGYLGEETLRRLEPEVRREIEEALLNKDLLIGPSVIKLAKELYSSKACFVFELLQNADDNSYSKAIAANRRPYVSFRIFPDRIIFECNEDGFTPDDLKAICSVGKSSRTGGQGFFGKRGTGFKSVFRAAWKVHIQSDAFSFSFSHRHGESGMGMVSPVWEATNEELGTPLTRITLHLHEIKNPERQAQRQAGIREQFAQVKQTVLLFMKKLRCINVAFCHTGTGEQNTSTWYAIERPRIHHAVICKRFTTFDGIIRKEYQHFHVTDQVVTNLPRNEARNYSQAEEEARAYSSSQVTLAFPLSETSVPIVEPQDLFVSLPVRCVGFSFLIQADFVTDASRQEIIEDSPRNWGLIDGVANAFVRAVLQFCDHGTLRYQWMRFLPDRNNAHMSTLWQSLVNKISELLSRVPVVYGRKTSIRHKIGYLLRPSPRVLDEDGQLLLDDVPEQIVSGHYDEADLDTLKDYGLKGVFQAHFNYWLNSDLQRGQLTRMKHPNTPETWHTPVAMILNRPFEMKLDNRMAELISMDLLPLEGGTWVSILSGPVYFAEAHGAKIPVDIGLCLISTKVKNAARRTLFKHLGVQTASAGLVRKGILHRYKPNGGPSPAIPLESSRRHLEFLYLTRGLASDEKECYKNLEVYDDRGRPCRPFDKYIYIANDDPYGPSELFRQTEPGPNPGDGAPGYGRAVFVNEAYFQDSPATPKDGDISWLDWFLYELRATDCVASFEAVEYVQKYRPEKFMGCLLAAYQRDEPFVPLHSDWIRNSEVLCRGNRRVPLADTYFPTRKLEELVDQFIEPGAFFPWIWLETDTKYDDIPPEWKAFLDDIEIRSSPTDLDLALAILEHTLHAVVSSDMTAIARDRLLDLYGYIQLKHLESTDQDESQQMIKKFFSEKCCIYIPLKEHHCAWAKPEQCVWNEVQGMTTKFPLQRMYQQFCSSNERRQSQIHFTGLFTETLGIQNSTWEIYVEELKKLKDCDSDNSDIIIELYKALNALQSEITTPVIARDAFECDALIYLPTDDGSAWHKASKCVWSNAVKLKGRVPLRDEYEDLKELFVDLLGVKSTDLGMAIDELQEIGSRSQTTAEDLKQSIWTVNSLLPTEQEPPAPGRILNSNIFPVRYPNGAFRRVSITTQFFLVDREPLRTHFEAAVKFLDFTLEELSRLRPFIAWAGLEKRQISLHVNEITSFHGSGASLISNPERQISNRAYALIRIARHFDSPRTKTLTEMKSFFSILRNGRLYESDEISSGLVLSQDGKKHIAVNKKLTLHLEEDNLGLQVYLPRDKVDQEYAYGKLLPEKLFAWMMRGIVTQIPHMQDRISKDGIATTRDVLLAPLSRIGMSLDDNGIARLDLECLEEGISDESEPPSTSSKNGYPKNSVPVTQEGKNTRNGYLHAENLSKTSLLPTPSVSNEQHYRTPTHSRHSEQVSNAGAAFTPESSTKNSHQKIPSAAFSFRSTPLPLRPSGLGTGRTDVFTSPSVTSNAEYVALLDKVIQAARWATNPFQGGSSRIQPRGFGGFNGVDLSAALGEENSLKRERRIRAAGELYVFEMLSRLMPKGRNLPGFSRDNWQSDVRGDVSGHPRYQDIQPWSGRKTSYRTYLDLEGDFTDFFVEIGFPERSEWASERPKYYIEVKTTDLPCETPFLMNKSQYNLMRRSVIANGDVGDLIYVIFRVFNLGRNDMGLQVYLDPESARLSGHLNFTAETWSVVPGPSAGSVL